MRMTECTARLERMVRTVRLERIERIVFAPERPLISERAKYLVRQDITPNSQ